MPEVTAEVMTPQLIVRGARSTVEDAAIAMRHYGVGGVIVTDGGRVQGIVTDRDIVVRGVAGGWNPRTTAIGDICTRDVVSVGPFEAVDVAVQLFRERAIRRLPVIGDRGPVGMISLGDLAVARDPDSVLAEISAAEPNF